MADFRYYSGMDLSQGILHYGVGHEDGGHSGRYPWGTGDKPRQDFKSRMQRRKTERLAKKDAKRYVDAKMFYGEGAGNRRKLLKAELNKKMTNPDYKEAFDRYVEEADFAKSAKKAKRERRARDVAKGIFGSRAAITLGTMALASATVYYIQNKDTVDAYVGSIANRTMSSMNDYQNRQRASRFLKRMGL